MMAENSLFLLPLKDEGGIKSPSPESGLGLASRLTKGEGGIMFWDLTLGHKAHWSPGTPALATQLLCYEKPRKRN